MLLINDLICWSSPDSDQRAPTIAVLLKMGPVFAYDVMETSETVFYLWLTTGRVKRRGRALMVMSNGYRTLSQHLNDLKKENFSLKLRIYFLEERIQQKYEESSEDVYRTVSQRATASKSCSSAFATSACLLTQLSWDDGMHCVFVWLSICCFFSRPKH